MKIYIKLFLVLISVFSLTSCLKDKNLLDPDGSKNVVEFYNVTAPVSPVAAPYIMYVPTTLDLVPEADFQIAVSYSGAELAAPQDIVVNLELAPEAVTAFNTSQSSAYVQMPTVGYEFPSTLTIKKGEKRAYGTVKVKPSILNQAVSNVLALKISSASHGTLSGNFGTVIYSLPIKSIWDGVYTYTIINPTEGNKTATDKRLSTVGPNLLETTGLFHHYSGWQRYQFSADNSTITAMTSFSGVNYPVTNLQVVSVDPVNRKFEVKWTVLGRNVTETYQRTGD